MSAIDCVFLPAGERQLYGRLFQPTGLGATLLIMPPIGPGRLGSMRALRACADTLSASGHACFLVDWRGCGDSSGSLADWRDWSQDVAIAIEHLRTRLPDRPLAVLYAENAVMAAAEDVQVDLELCWDPPLSGADLLDDWRRRETALSAQQGWALDEHRLLGEVWPAALLAAWQTWRLQAAGQQRVIIAEEVGESTLGSWLQLSHVDCWRAEAVQALTVPALAPLIDGCLRELLLTGAGT